MFSCGEATLVLLFSPTRLVSRPFSTWMAREVLSNYVPYGIIANLTGKSPRLPRYRFKMPISPKNDVYCSVRFPPWDSVITRTYSFKTQNEQEIDELIDLPADISIKAVVIIVYEDTKQANRVLGCLRRRYRDFPLAGCYLSKTFANHSVRCVVFAGDNVVAASCVLDHDLKTTESLQDKLTDFIETVTPTSNSVLLTFRCCDRQEIRGYSLDKNVTIASIEAQAIAKIFPFCSSIGCYALRTYGNENFSDAPPTKRKTVSFLYGRTTTLLYIGYK